MKSPALLILLAVIVLASPAAGDTLNPVGQWNPWVTPTQPNAIPFGATAFWDNVSKDGTQNGFGNNCSVGYWVSGLGGCNAVNAASPDGNFYKFSPGDTPAYLGDGDITSTFTLTPEPGLQLDASAAVAVSALSGDVPSRGTTTFGWVLKDDDPNDPTKRHPLLDAMQPVQNIAIPSGEYALYIAVTDNRPDPETRATTVFTSNTLDPLNRAHFAVFDLGNGLYAIGIEDKLGRAGTNWSDYDYNDLVVFVHTTPVPEPATFLVMGIGLLGGAIIARRRRAK